MRKEHWQAVVLCLAYLSIAGSDEPLSLQECGPYKLFDDYACNAFNEQGSGASAWRIHLRVPEPADWPPVQGGEVDTAYWRLIKQFTDEYEILHPETNTPLQLPDTIPHTESQIFARIQDSIAPVIRGYIIWGLLTKETIISMQNDSLVEAFRPGVPVITVPIINNHITGAECNPKEVQNSIYDLRGRRLFLGTRLGKFSKGVHVSVSQNSTNLRMRVR